MHGQGSGPVNTAMIDSLIARINAAKGPADLQRYASQAMEPINAQIGFVQGKLNELAPFMALMQLPGANPAEIVTWLGKLATAMIGPQMTAYTNYAAALPQLLAKFSELEAAIRDAERRITNVSIELPPTPVITIPGT